MARGGRGGGGGQIPQVVEGTVKKLIRKADVKVKSPARPKRVSVKQDPYQRPSGYRKGVREKVLAQNRSRSGTVRDPATKQRIDPNKPWDMGHKPGYEFRKHRESAQQRGITRKQFLDEHNDPSHYRPELPSSNRNHKGEDHSDDYYGP